MRERLPRRGVALGIAAAVVAAGVAIGIAIGGNGDDEPPSKATRPATPERRTAVPPEGGRGSDGVPGGRRSERREARKIVATVTLLVAANERGDGATVCRLLGRDAGGARGLRALERCARAAAIDVDRLPTSDELAIERTTATDGSATVRLAGGATLALARAGSGWRIRDFRPASG